MLQGLAMFDAEQRLIVCNRHYSQMYGLTADQVRPGTTIRAILQHRLANGSYVINDNDSFLDSWTSNFGNVSTRVQELADGRIIIANARYAEIYGLPAELTKPGTSLHAILACRLANGEFGDAPLEDVHERFVSFLGNRELSQRAIELPDGRCISVSLRRMGNG